MDILRRILKWCVFLLVTLVLLILVGATAVWSGLRASLAKLDGRRPLPGLTATVTVERDSLGVPTIRAATRLDAARATGFLHAQDRYFQMDLARRASAGELAALLGAPLVETDRGLRQHRFRNVARQVTQSLPTEDRALMEAYVEGVNVGLKSLKARPPEYFLLRCRPEAWRLEDSVLVVLSMWLTLADPSGWDDSIRDALRRTLPAPAYAFFAPGGTEWDAALDDTIFPPPPMPTPGQFSFVRSNAPLGAAVDLPTPDRAPITGGSNGWAVDGAHTRGGAALVANDMHLGQAIPGTWYRLRLLCPSHISGEEELDVTGVTLPGAPAIVVGSNRHIAWGFTTAVLDVTDVVLLEVSPDDPTLYRTPQGWKRFDQVQEVIHVRGATHQPCTIEWTIWGPVVPAHPPLAKRAVRYAPHLAEATNFRLWDLERAQDVPNALAIAPRCGIPPQNLVVGDRTGAIGWTIAGRLPRRIGFDGRHPVSWADGSYRWEGWRPPGDYPRVVSPANGRIWSANHRHLGSSDYLSAWVGNGLDARARQIRDDLLALPLATPQDMLAIQLDHEAVFLKRWQALLLQMLDQSSVSNRADIAELRLLVNGWGARAATNSAGYRFVRHFHDEVRSLILEPITQRCREVFPDYNYGLGSMEQPVWSLLQQRPVHLLNPRFKSYDELLLTAVNQVLSQYRRQGLPLAAATWGNYNRATLQHPLSRGAPFLSRWLDLPTVELAGDDDMPRAQFPWPHGASERLAVSPGREEEGVFHMPAGQSGHFLSPFYRAGHGAWVEGRATPFLPGPARHRLELVPVPAPRRLRPASGASAS